MRNGMMGIGRVVLFAIAACFVGTLAATLIDRALWEAGSKFTAFPHASIGDIAATSGILLLILLPILLRSTLDFRRRLIWAIALSLLPPLAMFCVMIAVGKGTEILQNLASLAWFLLVGILTCMGVQLLTKLLPKSEMQK